MREAAKNALATKIGKALDKSATLKVERDEAWAQVFADTTVSGRRKLEAIAVKLSNKSDNLMVRIGRMGDELAVLWGNG